MISIRSVIICTLFMLLPMLTMAQQVWGVVSDSDGNPLPQASIYSGRKAATIADEKGRYSLEVNSGRNKVVIRHLGYHTQVHRVDVPTGGVQLDVQLKLRVTELRPINIEGDRVEDPAVRIIKAAQKQRKYHRDLVQNYSFTAYVKSMQTYEEVSDKNERKSVDDSVGVVYLAELVSQYYFMQPDREKEVVLSSQVGGRSKGISDNSAIDLQFRLYENLIFIDGLTPRGIVSPIARNARSMYRFRLLETYGEGDLTVHRIALLPKRSNSPAFGGVIEIQDSTWRIHSAELMLTRNGGLENMDSLFISQLYVPVENGIWLQGQAKVDFYFEVGDTRGHGYSSGYFTNTVVNTNLEKSFFSGATQVIRPSASDKADLYWDTARTVQLTQEEIYAYRKQDSIARTERTASALDSADVRNTYEPINIATGYTYRSSKQGVSYGYASPLKGLEFNTVEGINLTVSGRYEEFDNETFKRLSMNADVRYGFKLHRPYARLSTSYLYDPMTFSKVYGEGGRYIFQFNESGPIPPLVNSVYSLLFEANYMKLYQKNYLKIGYGREAVNGLMLDMNLEYSDREALTNNTAYAIINRNGRAYMSNNPQDVREIDVDQGYFHQPLFFDRYQALILELGATATFDQKYFERPGQKVIISSKYPQVYGKYRAGIPTLGSEASFQFLMVGVKQELSFGLVGRSEYDISFGNFLSKSEVPFVDHVHFHGNQTIFGNNGLKSFDLLPYYLYSTNSTYYQAHFEHHFAGFLLNRIPELGEYGLQSVFSLNLLNTTQLNQYFEMTAGIENIFKVARIDFAISLGRGSINDQGIRIYIDL